MGLYHKYRPATPQEVVGQGDAIKILERKLANKDFPSVIMLSGPTGVGKTSIARIYSGKLGCKGTDLNEINAADDRGIDTARDITNKVRLEAMYGKCRVWIIDECHKFTNEAQTVLLKTLEDTPENKYFFLCTTEPNKVIKAIRNGRCMEIKLKGLNNSELQQVISRALKGEKKKLHLDVFDKIIDTADGSARYALTLTESVLELDNTEEQLDYIAKSSVQAQAKELIGLLLNPRTKWPEVSKLIKCMQEEEPERIRHYVLVVANNMLIANKQSDRMFLILRAFQDNWYDSKKAGLSIACYSLYGR